MSFIVCILLTGTTATAAHMSSSSSSPIPTTMTSVHRGLLGCQTPFNCVKTRIIPTPTPKAGEVLIAVGGSSVNPCDVDYVEYGVGCPGAAGTLGMDAAGTIVAVGSGVDRLKVGDEVWADGGGIVGDTGAMAQYAILSEAQTGLKPKSLNMTEAGTIPLVGLTALECLIKAGLEARETESNLTVVITSGSGGTGFIGVQLAKHVFNAKHVVTATTGAATIALIKSFGADVVIDYTKDEIFDALPDDSVDIVFDNFGAKGTADKAMRAIRSGGTYLILPGGGGGTISKHPKAGVRQINFGLTTSTNHSGLDSLAQWFDAGKLQAHVFGTWTLETAKGAFAANKAGQVVGKVAVTAQ